MLPDFLDLSTIYLIIHVFGAVLGAGGAFMSDAIFFTSARDGKIDEHEYKFMNLGGKMVWLGLGVLVISGIFLVSTNPEYYLSSTKFLAKATIVGIIIVNGIIFHTVHLPNIRKHAGAKFSDAPVFLAKSSFLVVSGAASVVSWVATVFLGMIKSLPYSYLEIMGVYLALLVFAGSGAILMKRKILSL